MVTIIPSIVGAVPLPVLSNAEACLPKGFTLLRSILVYWRELRGNHGGIAPTEGTIIVLEVP